jgi:uncharacterized membrane protein YvbJ
MESAAAQSTTDKILSSISEHPGVILAFITALILVIVAMYFGWLSGSKKETMKKMPDGDDITTVDEIDKLIGSINDKQSGNKK